MSKSTIDHTPASALGLSSVLAVIAHPDDESFGLGAVISALLDAGVRISVLCFTRGAASTLRGTTDDLAAERTSELADAARVLGIDHVELLDYPDGALGSLAHDELVEHARTTALTVSADALLVFDEGGVTGHPDHVAATSAGVTAATALGLGALAWCLPVEVADTLRGQYGAAFVGRPPEILDVRLTVDRSLQRQAAACHPSQAVPDSPLWRRLELLGDDEWLRWLRRPDY